MVHAFNLQISARDIVSVYYRSLIALAPSFGGYWSRRQQGLSCQALKAIARLFGSFRVNYRGETTQSGLWRRAEWARRF
jgi:hypothetical protein